MPVVGKIERAILKGEKARETDSDSMSCHIVMSELQLSQDSSRKHLVLPSISAPTTKLDTAQRQPRNLKREKGRYTL